MPDGEKVETKAPAGKFRIIEIDISYADGFLGTPEECARFIRDCDSWEEAWEAVAVPNSGRLHYQAHDESGRCILSYDGTRHIDRRS